MPQPLVRRSAVRHAAVPKSTGTDNVLFDLGFPDAASLTAKTILSLRLNRLIDHQRLTPREVGALAGLSLTEVHQLRRFKLQDLSLKRLRRLERRLLSPSASESSPARR